MTAEVVVLNKMAVALAADSKVTIGRDGEEKTYDSVNKLFTLSKCHPVGVMIYGSAEFMGVPWETIIKIFREKKRNKQEPTVKDWAVDFVNFLSKFRAFPDDEIDGNVAAIIMAHFSDLRAQVGIRFMLEDGADPDEILLDEISKLHEAVSGAESWLEKDECKKLVEKYKKLILAIADNISKNFEKQKQKILKSLTSLAQDLLCRLVFSPLSSGIVFAGFGSDEIFPSVVSYNIDGFVGTRIKYELDVDFQVSNKRRCGVIPFAQQDMVYRFMEGIDQSYSEFLQESIRNIMVSNAVSVLETYADPALDMDETRKIVAQAANDAFEAFLTKAVGWRQDRFAKPITGMVGSLPKDEIANLAESLVNLTSLKRRVSRDRETVGGPVDVAVISKGDGFVWIKRKHYFQPELNLHFKANYFRQIGREDHE